MVTNPSLYKQSVDWSAVFDEALKSWQHFAADEIVYESHKRRAGGEDCGANAYVEAYCRGYSHVEILLHSLREPKRYAAVLIRRAGRETRFGNAAIAELDFYPTEYLYRKLVLVAPRKKIQAPETSDVLSVWAIPSVTWLKVFDDLTDGWFGDVLQWPSAIFEDVVKTITITDNREGGSTTRTSLASLLTQFSEGQLPGDVIQSGAKIRDCIAQYRGQLVRVGRVDGLDVEVKRCLKVVFENNSIDYFIEKEKPSFEIIDVKHRPFEFESGPVEWMESLMPNQDEKPQKTAEGHEIPVPKRREFLDNLKKVSEPDTETDDDSTTDDAKEE